MASRRTIVCSRRLQQAAVFTGAVVLMGLAVASFDSPVPTRGTAGVIAPTLSTVSVLNVTPGTYRATISSWGEARPRNAIVLRAHSAGEVRRVGGRLLPGERVMRDEILVELDATAQRAAVAEARNRLAQAELAVLTEERMAATAASNWDRAGEDGLPRSSLVLRRPQLEAAQAERIAARAALEEAQRDLERTAVRAPFDGIVTARTVSLGELVDTGQGLGVLIDGETLDLEVALTPAPMAAVATVPDRGHR